MGTLEARGLIKRLGGNTVVDGVSLRIVDGEFVALLGASGSGKTTLLRMICGLEQPDEGQILIDSHDVTRLPARERNLGMVFQDYGLYPNMNVFQNIAYGLEARGGYSKAEIEQRVTQAAARLGLDEMLKRSIVDLSGGEQQRVALARALAKDASAYLFDEPLSNLDPKLRYQARRDILALHRSKGKPSLYVTHDQTEAFAMADRIALLAGGGLQQVGSAEDLLHAPANMYVARFVGSPAMNLISCDIQRHDSGLLVVADGLAVRLPKRWAAPLDHYHKDRVVLGIRPDAFTPSDQLEQSPDAGTQKLVGQVEDVYDLVGETVVSLALGQDTHLSALFQDDGSIELSPGDRLHVDLDVDRICLFDPDSEQALGAGS
jgi:ABC-type sugar transport system ATPase subunit